ncbi:MAG: amidohydrolase family protein [Nitrospinota bacterium]|nr:amidohydrolase family protein [Nitrospinota bacterium]
MSETLLIQDCGILDPALADDIVEGRDILISGDRIAAVEPTGNLKGDRVVSGRDRLVLPGLINAHTHSAENYLKGLMDRRPLEMWLPCIFGTAGVYSPRDVYLSCMIGAIEMLKTGATSVIDHCWMSPGISPDGLDAAMEAYRDAGIRACLAPLVSDTDYVDRYAGERGHPVGDTFFGKRFERARPWEETLDHLRGFFAKWDRAEGGRLRCMTGPAGVQWCGERLLEDCWELSRSHQAGVHLHINETFIQDWANRKRFGKSAIAFLDGAGLLGPDVSMPHSLWVNDADFDLIASAGAVPVHNPAANTKMGSGLMSLRKMLDRGIPVAVGTDGAASSDHQVLFEAVRMAAYIHNSGEPDHRRHIDAREAIAMATTSGAAAMMASGELGEIKPGALADLALLDRRSLPWVPTNDPIRNLVYCEGGRSVHTTLVAGRVVVDDGKILTVDEGEIVSELLEAVADRGQAEWPGCAERDRTVAVYERFCDDMAGLRPAGER